VLSQVLRPLHRGLAGAALVASLLVNKKPSNKTGYTSIDLDEFKPVSFGMEGGKYSKENVDQTMQNNGTNYSVNSRTRKTIWC
jgi:hypothetical protein